MSRKDKQERILGQWPRKCKVCRKEFYANIDLWKYQIIRGPRDRIWFCSWKCLRQFEKEQEAKKK